MAKPLFVKSIARALKYRILDVNIIERIAVLLMKEGNIYMPLIQINYGFEQRQSFLEGCDSDEVDLSIYDKSLENDNE